MTLSPYQAAITSLVQKAAEDSTFKANLISKPNETINQFLGQDLELPKNKKILFIDQSDTQYIYFNIPQKPTPLDIELSEDDLDAISGGTGGIKQPVII